jgi:hypothetical protein
MYIVRDQVNVGALSMLDLGKICTNLRFVLYLRWVLFYNIMRI